MRGRAFVRLATLAVLVVTSACQGSIEDRLSEIQGLQDAGQFQESIEPLRTVLAEAPDNAQANQLLGAALLQTSQPSLAIYPLERAARDPGHAVASGLLLASAYLNTDAYENAVRAADIVLAVDPNRSAAVYIRGHANLGAGKYEEALADADRLVEMTPKDYQALLLRAAILWDLKRLDEAEKAYTRLKEVAAERDPAIAAKGWLALATFYRNAGKTERAEQEFEAILKQFPTDGTALSYATQFYDETKRPEKGTAVWRNAVKEAPENVAFRLALAQRLEEQKQPAEAEKTLVEATELFGTADTWLRLSEFLRRQNRHEEAIAAMDKAVEISGTTGNDAVYMEQAEMYADAGDLAKAKEIAAKITEPSYRDIIEGRILLGEGKAKEALARLDAGVRRWPNNAGARYLAGRAALETGDLDRAAAEFVEAYRAGPDQTEASLAIASLELARGNYTRAVEFGRNFLQTKGFAERPSAADAHIVVIRAATALGEHEVARNAATALAKLPGQSARAAVERAAVERAAQGPKAAAASVEKSGLDLTDPANELALRALVGDLLATERAAEAEKRVDAALAAHPDVAAFHDLRGRVLARGERAVDAKAAFEKAVALDPQFAPAIGALATLAMNGGDSAAALALFDRAAKASDKDTTYAYQAAQLVLAAGRTDDAERRLREIVAKDPGNASAGNDLAWILAEKGTDLDLALGLAQTAARVSPSADFLDTLGWVQLKRKDAAGAVESLRQALAKRPESPSIRYRLGLALAESGDAAAALRELQASLAQGAFPEADAARAQVARLEGGAK